MRNCIGRTESLTSKPVHIGCLCAIVSVLAACGSDGDSDKERNVEITTVLRCGIDQPIHWHPAPLQIPDNCPSEPISGRMYETDQSAVHLMGSSFEPESESCSNPPYNSTLPTLPYLSGSYEVTWKNLTNGASAEGSAQCAWDLLSSPDRTVNWSSHKFRHASLPQYLEGIPLKLGENVIRISAHDSGLRGMAEIKVTRVADITLPAVHSVDPEPGGTYYFRIVVYFDEQLDLASTMNALLVVDDIGMPVPGMSDYDPLDLAIVWQPQTELDPATTYTAEISGISDLAGNVMAAPYQWSFITPP